MTRHTTVMSTDDAIRAIVSALHDVATALGHRSTEDIDALVHQRLEPADDHETAMLARYRRRMTRVRTHGHGWLIDDQIEGYLSALDTDPTFHPHAA